MIAETTETIDKMILELTRCLSAGRSVELEHSTSRATKVLASLMLRIQSNASTLFQTIANTYHWDHSNTRLKMILKTPSTHYNTDSGKSLRKATEGEFELAMIKLGQAPAARTFFLSFTVQDPADNTSDTEGSRPEGRIRFAPSQSQSSKHGTQLTTVPRFSGAASIRSVRFTTGSQKGCTVDGPLETIRVTKYSQHNGD